MARFDFVESASAGYQFLMYRYDDIGRLMLVPLAIKIVSFWLVIALGLQDNLLRQGLFLLPSYFAEGWLVAQLIRLAIFKESWPFVLSGDQKKDAVVLLQRSRSILSSTIIYVLIALFRSLFAGLVQGAEQKMIQQVENGASAEPSTFMYFLSMVLVLFMIWAFRALWVYVPVAMGISAKAFLQLKGAFRLSLCMVGTWLLCIAPLAVLMLMIFQVLTGIFPSVLEEGNIPNSYLYIDSFFRAFIELIMAVVSSVAMAYGIYSIYRSDGGKV